MGKRNITTKILLVSVFFGLLFLHKPAYASYAYVSALFKWENLNISGNIQWIENDNSYPKHSYVYGYAKNDSGESWDETQNYDWNQLQLAISIPQARAKAETGSYISSESIAGPHGQIRPYSESVVRKEGYFTYLESSLGNLTVSIPYKVRVTLFASSDPGSYARGDLKMSFYLKNINTSYDTQWSYNLSKYVNSGGSFSKNIDDLITMGLRFEPGNIGSISFEIHTQAYAESVVPLPATLTLVATGLTGIFMFGRRRLLWSRTLDH
ncbi:MAG: hypothetical protein N2513_06775 [Deltaproteobacteria bacterium]|nr:hypothetical protein [Deltaproteobacteria bacterium]